MSEKNLQAADLEAFRKAASGDGAVIALRKPGGVEVVAMESAPAASAHADIETTRLFIERLREFFGDTIGSQVVRQIGLDTGERGALEARDIRAALEMAAASRSAFAGVNFVSRHALSARHGSPQFRIVCMALGVAPESLLPAVRERADALFAARFEAACDSDRRCVDVAHARNLMAAALREALDQGPESP